MTRDDFPDGGRYIWLGEMTWRSGMDAPTEREPSTAIFRFFKISPVMIKNGRGVEFEEKRGTARFGKKKKPNGWTAIGSRFISGIFRVLLRRVLDL
jgi:hypothetical protein